MPVTGVYFIPSNPNAPTALATVVKQLQAAYSTEPSGRWALEHKLLRDTPSCLPLTSRPPVQPRYMQLLSLSHFQSHGFVYISDRPSSDPWDQPQNQQSTPTPTPAPAVKPQQVSTPQQATNEADGQGASSQSSSSWTMMTPDPASFNSFFAITLRACEPLWCYRHTMVVSGGMIFEAGNFRVRLGDVRQVQPTQRVRGCIVEIEYCGPGKADARLDGDLASATSTATASTKSILEMESALSGFSSTAAEAEESMPTEEDWAMGEKLIRDFWSRFSISGAREAIRVPGLMTEVNKARQNGTTRVTTIDAGPSNTGIAGVDLARQYMEVLRLSR